MAEFKETDRQVACRMLEVAFGFAPSPYQVMIEQCGRNGFGDVKELVFRVSPCAIKYEYRHNIFYMYFPNDTKVRLPIDGFSC